MNRQVCNHSLCIGTLMGFGYNVAVAGWAKGLAAELVLQLTYQLRWR